MTAPQFDPNLLAYLQAWRQYLEQMAGAATTGFGIPPTPQWPVAAPPAMPLPPALPPMPPAFAGPPSHLPTPATDYTQQLLAVLQAWRQYLEQSAALATVSADVSPGAADEQYTRPRTDMEPVPPPNGGGSMLSAADIASPPLRTGSAYASESGSGGYGAHGPVPPRSLYRSAATADAGNPAATTTWWNHGRPPAGATSTDASTTTPRPNASAPMSGGSQRGDGAKIPPDVELVAPSVHGSAMAPLKRPVQPSLLRSLDR